MAEETAGRGRPLAEGSKGNQRRGYDGPESRDEAAPDGHQGPHQSTTEERRQGKRGAAANLTERGKHYHAQEGWRREECRSPPTEREKKMDSAEETRRKPPRNGAIWPRSWLLRK